MPSKAEMHRRARSLRNGMTPEEKHLFYDYFKHLSLIVRRQMPVGMYIADFYISEAKLVIELDGSQHYETDGRAWDERRDHFFAEQGILVLRYSNAEVNLRFHAVCEDITLHIEQRIKHKLTYR